MLPGLLAAQGSLPDRVPADKGALSSSGKFVSKDAPGSPQDAPDPAELLASAGIKLDGDMVKIGLVELDRKTHSVSFPARLQMTSGIIEYVVVHANGKVHESLFVTDALPQDIHIACLLAGWADKKTKEPRGIIIKAVWPSNGPPRSEPLENLVALTNGDPQGKASGQLSSGSWDYVGSFVDSAGFAATREGSVIAVINDPAALAGNPRKDREDDTVHIPNAALLPRQGLPVRIILSPAPPP